MLESSGHISESCTLKNYVTEQADSPILGYKACKQLKLVKCVNILTCVPKQSALTKQHIKQEYADVFKGVGQYEKEYHMELNEKVVGVIEAQAQENSRRVKRAKYCSRCRQAD